MRITNPLHFSEYHRFCVKRDFALSSLDYRVLTSLYQPMIGGWAIALYHTLFQQLPADKVGCSVLEQQRKLFLAMEMEAGERGRKQFIEQTSRLEAVGLLKSVRHFAALSDDYIYEYILAAPLTPVEFFRNQHLTLLLRDKVGKYMLLALRDELILPAEEELSSTNSENLSVPFYELFTLNTQVVDHELEQALFETAAAAPPESKPDYQQKGYDYTEIISHFPRQSLNREYVENLRYEPEQMAQINYVAKKYQLYLTDICRLLDEEGVFNNKGALELDLLQHKANQVFRQDKKRSETRARFLAKLAETGTLGGMFEQSGEETGDKQVEMEFYLEVPDLFQSMCNQHQYNYILRNEPYTFLLEKIFSKGSIPDGMLDMFAKIDLNYGLAESVINVLIHFLYVSKRSWAKSYVETIAADMLAKQVSTFEQAVMYIREQVKYQERKSRGAKTTDGKGGEGRASTPRGRSSAATGRQKPQLPVVQGNSGKTLTEAEREELRRKALKLDGKL